MRWVHAACAALAFVVLEQCRSRLPPTAPGSSPSRRCVTPTDTQGRPLYDAVRGQFVERRIDQGGGYLVLIKPAEAAANQAVVVTREVFDAVGVLQRARMITLFAYVSRALSGASPPFSCVEL
jgi:hypothetical protein